MRDDYTILAVFEYSTEALVFKSKLDAEDIKTMLMDEKTIEAAAKIAESVMHEHGVVTKNRDGSIKQRFSLYQLERHMLGMGRLIAEDIRALAKSEGH